MELANVGCGRLDLEEPIAFGQQHHDTILWGAWLQAVGPVLIAVFALAIVVLAGATARLAGWMTLFGAATLMSVSLIEIVGYIGTLQTSPPGAVHRRSSERRRRHGAHDGGTLVT